MAFIEYTYSIINDTLNGEVSLTALTEEILADPLASVGFLSIRLSDVTGLPTASNPQDMFIGYDPALDPAGETALDAVVAAHDGVEPASANIFLVDSDVDFQGNQLLNVGNVNGVGFDTFVGDTNTHIGRTDNPHSTSVATLDPGTLAELNANLTDGNVDDASSPRTPTAHSATHSAGGPDEIQHNNLAGLATGDPHTQYLNTARFNTEFAGKTTDDLSEGTSNFYYTETRVSNNSDVSANTTHRGRTDNPHGTDLGNLGSGTLAELNATVTDANLDDAGQPRTPTAHASTHSQGGSDEIAAQNLGSGLAPANLLLQTDGTGGWSLIATPSVVSDHGGLTGLGDDDHPQYVLEDGTRAFSGNIDAGGNNLVNVGTVDGIDVSAQATITNAHIASTSNPHSTNLANLGAGTLADLNSTVTDATLDDISGARTPTAHASTHEVGGGDVIVAQNLGSGGALGNQILESDGLGGWNLIPTPSVVTDHGALTGLGDDDHTQYTLADGTRAFSGDIDLGTNDITNVGTVDGVDVSAQAATTNAHIADTNNPHGTDLGNLGAGTLAELNTVVTDATLDDVTGARTPTSHAATHADGGSDPLSHNALPDLTVGDPHTQYTTEARARAAAPVQPTTGVPSNALGQDGDLAIDPDNADVYEKTAGVWGLAANLVGPEGPPGFGLGAFARTAASGVLLEGRGLTVTRTANGRYEYTFTQPAANNTYVVIGQPIDTTTDSNIQFSTANISTTGFRLEVGQGDNGTAADILIDRGHSVIVLGDGIQGPGGITSAYESWLNSGNVGTEADFIADLVGPAGPGIIAGGTTGQVLRKASNADFDTEFATLTATDVGADPAGTAAAAVAAHEAALDPHPQYINDARFDTEFATKSTTDLAEGTNLYYTEARVSANTDVAANTAHRNTTGNPHSTTPADIGAIPTTEKGAASGVATLDVSGKIPTSQIPAAAIPEFFVVLDIPARDALTVQEGDEAFVQSNGLQYIFDGTSWFERPAASGTVTNPGASTDNALARFDGVTGQVIQNSSTTLDDTGNMTLGGDLNLSTNDITNVTTINGTNFSTFVSNTNTHIADTANPHGTDLGNLGSGTLAELNALVTDATLDDVTGARTPTSHASTHEVGGGDVIVAQNLSSGGALANLILESDGAGGWNLISTPTVITDHGALTGLEDDDHIQYFRTDGLRTMTGDIDAGGFDILNVGDVDGVDISAQAATTNAHIASTANPHNTSIANIGSGTLAQLNAAVTDATLDDASDPRTPTAHASTHSQGGSDEITAQDLGSGAAGAGQTLLTDGLGGWTLSTPLSDHGALTGLGDDDHPQYLLVNGSRNMSGNLNMGGFDIDNVSEVDGVIISALEATTQGHILDTNNPHGTNILNIPDFTLGAFNSKIQGGNVDFTFDPRTPTAHASTHIQGGSDEIDGDQIDIDFTPTVYVPDTTPAEATSVDHLTAHLAGIDNALVYGSNLVFGESLAGVENSTTTFVQKLRITLNVTAANAGTYRLDWSYIWNHNANGNDFQARIQQNDSSPDLMFHKQEPKDSAGAGIGGTSQRYPASGSVFLNLTAGTYNFDLDFNSDTAGVISAMFDARMSAYRIA